MQVSRRKICILIISHNVTIAQEYSGQRKTINRCNDSLGKLLFFATVLLQQHRVVMLMVLNAGFFADQHSTEVAKFGIDVGRFTWDVSLIGMAAALLSVPRSRLDCCSVVCTAHKLM